jgi:hypothetical protein
MDSIRAKFFWRGPRIEFKYHMVKWQVVCRPKDFGGLGIINNMLFNECLIDKWIWKIYKQKNSLWVRLLTRSGTMGITSPRLSQEEHRGLP